MNKKILMRRNVYTSKSYQEKGLIGNLKELYFDVKHYRHLLYSLVRLSITQQYKKSLLGYTWIIISPLLSVVIWVILQASGLFNPGDTQVPYLAFVLLSNSIWAFFISFYKGISESLTTKGGEIIQNNFPKIIIVVERIIISFFDFMIPLILSILVLMFFGVEFTWSSLLFLPALLPLIAIGISLGLLFSVIKVIAVDFNLIFNNFMEVLKYLTPVVYSTAVASDLILNIIKWNPLTYLIDLPRNLLLGSGFENWDIYLWISFGSLILLLLAIRFYYLATPWVIEKMTL